MLFGLGAINLAKNPDGLLAMIGHDRLEKRREKEREARIAEAESELHQGEAVTEVAAVPEDAVLDGGRREPRATEPPRRPSGAHARERGRRLRRRRGAPRGDRRRRAGPGRRAARRERRRASPRCAASPPGMVPITSGHVIARAART